MVEVDRGRRAYAREAWLEAYEQLSAADRREPLGVQDVGLLATATYMIGRESEYLVLLERAYSAYLASGERLEALRCAVWMGVGLARRGEAGRASGWLGRAQRLLDECGTDRVEQGYLLLPVVFEQAAGGDLEAAAVTAAEAATIGREYGDADLVALAAHEQGHFLIRLGRGKDGLRLLDETMVAVTAGELSPVVSGIVYCGVILACQEAFELRRAQEWTAALSDWCDRQPDLVAFTGRCLTHRAELLQLHPSFAPRKGRSRLPPRRSEGRWRNAPSRGGGRACCRPSPRSRSRWATSRPRARRVTSCRRSRRVTRTEPSGRAPLARGARSTWRRAIPRRRSSRSAGRRRRGSGSRRRTRWHASASSSDWPVAPSTTKTLPRWSSTPRARRTPGSTRLPISPGLPDARHERHFEADGDGFRYRLVVEYDPRGGFAGLVDRMLLPRAVRRALESTITALDEALAS